MFILRLARKFFHQSWGKGYDIPFDPESAMQTIDALIENGIMLVGPTSYAGAILTPCMWNHEFTIATVITWYFESPREIRIFDALMEECRKAGATHFVSASNEGSPIGRYYNRKGLTIRESAYMCQL